jgi:hypothetical protein
MNRSCLRCQQSFAVTDEDLAFLDKVSPVFNGKKELIPPPLLCPQCRLQRRLCERNTRSLYYRKCDLTGKQIISQYNTDQVFPVYGIDAWNSDQWDGTDYGREFDFSRSFFEQFQELLSVVPHLALFNTPGTMENCDYNNCTGYLKNCYLLAESDLCEDSFYANLLKKCKDTVDCSVCYECERCYECIDCIGCFALLYSQNCQRCSNGLFLKNCIGCHDCIGCINQRQKQYMIFNVQYTKEEYEAHRESMALASRTGLMKLAEQAQTYFLSHPHRSVLIEHSEGSSGDRIDHCKNALQCFDVSEIEDCRYCQMLSLSCKDCMDFNSWGQESELVYQSAGCGDRTYRTVFSSTCITVKNALYSFECFHCSDVFGCTGLKNKQYCILNKQYSKEEYEALVPKIIAHMRTTNEWGSFFPMALCPFAYNESFAPDFFPLTKEDVLQRGWRWYEKQETDGQYLGAAVALPEHIEEVPETITKQILICAASGKPYKIIPQELKFYQSMHIPAPTLSPDERHRRRIAKRNPYKLWSRKCQKCEKDIQTTYSPDRLEIVYCESCYLASVY